ncbi:hypothetical protein Tco_1548280 [Tanacetum coccineum]
MTILLSEGSSSISGIWKLLDNSGECLKRLQPSIWQVFFIQLELYEDDFNLGDLACARTGCRYFWDSARGKSHGQETSCFQSIPDDHVAAFSLLWMMQGISWNAVAKLRDCTKVLTDAEDSKSSLKLNSRPSKLDEIIILKFLRALPSSWSQVALTLKTKGGLEFLSFDDLYYKLKTLEVDIKGYSTFSSSQSASPSHYAFVSTTSASKKMSYLDSPCYSSSTYMLHQILMTGSYQDCDKSTRSTQMTLPPVIQGINLQSPKSNDIYPPMDSYSSISTSKNMITLLENHSEDPLASAMLLLAKAITQNFYNPTNNHLRASSNTRNQAVVQGDRVNIQSRNSSNVGRNNRRAYVQGEVVEGMNATN